MTTKQSIIFFLSLMICSLSFSNTISLNDAINIYLKNSPLARDYKTDSEIQSYKRNTIIQNYYQDLNLNLRSSYNSKREPNQFTLNGKALFNKNYYLSLTPRTENSGKITKENTDVEVGITKNLNDFFFDTPKSKLLINTYDSTLILLDYFASIQKNIDQICTQYLTIKELEDTLASNENIIVQKKKDLEIAEIKLKGNMIGSFEVESIKSNISKLESQNELTKLQIKEAKENLMFTLNMQEDIALSDISAPINYQIFINKNTLKQLEIQLAKEEESLKSIKHDNLPQASADLAYNISNQQITAGLSISYNPFDYKGTEKESLKKIEKLKNQINDEEENIRQSSKKSINELAKQEFNIKIAYEDMNTLKKELDKFEILSKQGAGSEYDLFVKQANYIEKEIAYKKAINYLNVLKIKNNILVETYEKLESYK